MFSDRLQPWTDRLTVTIKPTWICNLSCHYCYQSAGRPSRGQGIMSDDVLEASIRAASRLPINIVDFQWIGGETLVPGVSFYKKAIEYTEKYAEAGGAKIVHWLQTNLTLINRDWIALLREYKDRLILSVSYDFFPEYFFETQQNRQKASEHHWKKIQSALDLLRENEISFGCLTTIDRNALQIRADEWFSQWIDQDIKRVGLQLDYNDVYSFRRSNGNGKSWRDYINFVEQVFDIQERYNQENRNDYFLLRESIYLYNKLRGVAGDAWVGSCHYSSSLCGHYFWTIDIDGKIYGMCDAFMTEKVSGRYMLGDVRAGGLEAIKASQTFEKLTDDQYNMKHSATCQACPVYEYCNGGCPTFKSKDNMLDAFDPESNYCQYTKSYFDNILDETKKSRILAIYDCI